MLTPMTPASPEAVISPNRRPSTKRVMRPHNPSLPPTDGATVCAWIEANLVHGEGDLFGRPFGLHAFQRRFLDRLYQLDPDGRRRLRRALLGLPKGNGKTELAAAIAVLELAGPFAPPSPVSRGGLVRAGRPRVRPARTMIAEGPLRPYFDLFDTEILRRDGPGRMYRVAAAAGTTTADGRPASSPTSSTSGRATASASTSCCPTASPSAGTGSSSTSARRAPTARRSWAGCTTTASASRRARCTIRRSCSSGTTRGRSGPHRRGALRAPSARPTPPWASSWTRTASWRAPRRCPPTSSRATTSTAGSPPRPLDRRPRRGQAAPTPTARHPGTDVVLGFDGSYSRDSTALVGCTGGRTCSSWSLGARHADPRLDGAAHRGGRRRGGGHDPLARPRAGLRSARLAHRGGGLGGRVGPRSSCDSRRTSRPAWGRPVIASLLRSRGHRHPRWRTRPSPATSPTAARATRATAGSSRSDQGQPAQDRPGGGGGRGLRARHHGTGARVPQRL